MKSTSIFVILLLASAGVARADSFALVVPDDGDNRKHPAAYWQLNYSPPRFAYTYSVSLEGDDIGALEDEVNKLAEKMNIPKNPQHHSYGRASSNRTLTFHTGADKAEAFCRKVITLGRLRNYSANTGRNENIAKEIRRKKEIIEDELEGKLGLFERLPIAETLMSDLLTRYKNYLNGYEDAKDKAAITISLTLKPR